VKCLDVYAHPNSVGTAGAGSRCGVVAPGLEALTLLAERRRLDIERWDVGVGTLEGKVAIVTGSGQGIGRGMALALAKEGASLMIAEFNSSTRAAVVEEVRALGGRAIGHDCDVSSCDEVEAMVALTAQELGGVDILINNAQSFGRAVGGSRAAPTPDLTGIEDFDDAAWDNTIRTGLYGSFYTMRAAFPHLRDGGAGRIINFGSGWGLLGRVGAVAYNATKEGIRGLSRTAAKEWGQYGITVDTVIPYIETDSLAEARRRDPERYEQIAQEIPLRRFGDAEKDAGRTVVFLAGDDASFLTNLTVAIDGGFAPRAG
jgi:NAD(P)-dependent dehydrogenase (short-subunit alcohol dehydrogenase family)